MDFGSDVAFDRVPQKLKEHYGIEVPGAMARLITERHGEEILESAKEESILPDLSGLEQVIAEMDGSMIPVVETSEREGEQGCVDRRKTRRVSWKEVRLCLVREVGSVTPVFGATMGTVDEAGDQLLRCAIRAGVGTETKAHCLGDGAPWIFDQSDRVFGAQASYLVDFYHVCDYLAAAGDKISGGNKEAWMDEQKSRLKNNGYQEILENIRPFVEEDRIPDKNAPVRACYRYISNRTNQLDYKSALAAGLPIGSGEIESAHRYVIQNRLKLAGAWWKAENAKRMLALRVLRANGDWGIYWENRRQKAA